MDKNLASLLHVVMSDSILSVNKPRIIVNLSLDQVALSLTDVSSVSLVLLNTSGL